MKWSVKHHIAVLGAYVVLSLVMSWPLATNLATHLAGSGGDPWQTMWRFENKEALVRSSLTSFEGFQELLLQEFLGGGERRLVNLSVWPWMWLHVLVGQPAAYNLIWLLSFVLSGYGMYLLVRYLTMQEPRTKNFAFSLTSADGQEPNKSQILNSKYPLPVTRDWLLAEAPAFLAGVAYMFLPYHVAQAQGHFGAMQLQWLPLVILALFWFIRRPTIRSTALLALLLTFQAWSEHHYMLWLLLFAVIFLIGYLREVRRFWRWRFGPAYTALLLAILFMTVVLPYWPTIRLAGLSGSSLILGQEQTIRFSTDLFAYIVPAPFHPVWGGLFNELFARHFTGNIAEGTHFLGLVPLLLVFFFHQRVPRFQKFFWLVVAFVFFIISLGPRLHILGRVPPFPLPYALIDAWPVFSSVRVVARAGVMVGLSTMVLLGWVLAMNIKRWQSALALLAMLILEFLFLPVPLQSADVSPAYRYVEELSGRSVLEIPAATNYVTASRALYASRQHGKDVLGNIALERALAEGDFQEIKSVPGVRQLLYLRTTDLREARDEFFGQALSETLSDTLAWLGVGAIIIHTDSLSAWQLASVRDFLEEQMRFVPQEFDDILIYNTEAADQSSAKSDGIFLVRGGGWQNVGFDPKRESVFAEVVERASVTIVNVTDAPAVVRLAFDSPPEAEGRLTVRVGETVVKQSHDVSTTVILVMAFPGENNVEFVNEARGKAIVQNPEMSVSNGMLDQ